MPADTKRKREIEIDPEVPLEPKRPKKILHSKKDIVIPIPLDEALKSRIRWELLSIKEDYRRHLITILIANTEPKSVSELSGASDTADRVYVKLRQQINLLNLETRRHPDRPQMALHDGCQHKEPHLICCKGSYHRLEYWIDSSLKSKLVADYVE